MYHVRIERALRGKTPAWKATGFNKQTRGRFHAWFRTKSDALEDMELRKKFYKVVHCD